MPLDIWMNKGRSKEEIEEIEMRHDFALILSNKVRMDQVWGISEDLKKEGFIADIEADEDEKTKETKSYVLFLAINEEERILAEAER